MSASSQAQIESAKESSKKRKHEGSIKESKKKKRKQENEVTEDHTEEEFHSKPAKKEKIKKDKSTRVESISESVSQENGTLEVTSPLKKDKKKKKDKHKELDEEPDRTAGDLSNSQQIDVDLPDALAVEDQTLVDAVFTSAVQNVAAEDDGSNQLQYPLPSSFHSTRMSLYLPTPPIGLDKAVAAMLTLHVTPLLLTYFPPAGGVILSIHDPVLSATPQDSLNQALLPPSGHSIPKTSTQAFPRVGDELGACWAWLTVTFLVYSPQPGDKLEGWTNAMSEGFIGLVCYNYFQTSIAKSRIPKTWSWSGPTRETRQRKTPKKGRLNDDTDGPSQDSHFDSQETIIVRDDDAIDGTAGIFRDSEGVKIPEQLQFQVVDLEMIPAQERGQLALQVEGTLLGKEEEAKLRGEERERFEIKLRRLSGKAAGSGTPLMSGGLATHSRASSVMPSS